MTGDNRPYRRSVGMMIVNRQGQVFAGHKAKFPDDKWEMPQGAIDPGESPVETAWRELAEETGIHPQAAQLVTMLEETILTELPEDLSRRKWKGRYRGEKQTWFLFLLEDEGAINIETDDPEYAAWQWLSPAEIVTRSFGYRQAAYRHITDNFAPDITRLQQQA